MILSNVSIKRPVFAGMLNLVLVVFGLFSLPKLPIDLYPDVDFPVVTVSVVYPGADPTSIEQRILDPLENSLNGLAGLKNLSSSGFQNLGQVVLQFDLDKDVNIAIQEVRDKVFATVGRLPEEAQTPIVQRFDIGGTPIINLALRGNLPISELSLLAKNVVQPAFERIDGVARVSPSGMRDKEIHVLMDRERLSSFGLTPLDISSSIQQQNLELPSGRIEEVDSYQTIRVDGKLTSASQIGRLPILSSQNLRISDVAEVKETIIDEETAAFVGDEVTILFAIQKQSGANTPEIAERVREGVDKINKQLPKGTSIEVVRDNSLFIKGSIDAVKLDLVFGALLAVLIVLLFLRDFRITFISALALPTAVIATFAFMRYMGFTLNMMTTLALSLSIGILIDDAIIVIENIHRHLTMGKSGVQAAKDASAEIGLAVVATTMTLCAVFVPVAFMDGIIGRFFFQFGMTVAFAVMISLFVALTLTPMLSSKLLVHHDDNHSPKSKLLEAISNKIGIALDALDASYRRLLEWCLNHRSWTLGGGVLLFIVSLIMLKFVPVAFFPKEDRSEFSVSYLLPEGTSILRTKEKSLALAHAIKKYPGVREVVIAVSSNDKKPNKSRLDVKMVPKTERDFSQPDMMNRLRKDLKSSFIDQGEELSMSEAGESAGGGGGGGGSPIQFILTGRTWEDLVKFSDQVSEFVKNDVQGSADVKTSKPKTQEEIKIKINTIKAADLGLTPVQIATAIRSLFEGEKVGDINLNGETTDIKIRISDLGRAHASDLASTSIRNRLGKPIPLSSVATLITDDAPSSVNRFNGQRQITVSSNFTGKDLNAAVVNIQQYIDKNLPGGVSATISGQAETMKNSIVSMLQALLLAVLLVLMILCAQYESFLAPLVIMAALPLALTGAFGALLITGQVMSVYTMIGTILLMGLVAKNGILLIDFTKQKIEEGLTVRQALLEAGAARLRPILMTTFAASGGMLPVAIGHGVGGESRSPMGVVVIGGLLASTFLTLVVVPCLFSVMEQARVSLVRRLSTDRHANS